MAMTRNRAARLSLALLLGLCWLIAAGLDTRANGEKALWTALGTPGHFALMRHALAPGTGDPRAFRLEDCATQRNLSDAGRRQARRTGAAFRQNAIKAARILSSQWCRCLETARLLELGPVSSQPTLNSFFQAMAQGPAQIERLRAVIAKLPLTGPVVMVTHQVVISGLVDVTPSSGEILVVRRNKDGSLAVIGRIRPRTTE